MIRAALGVVAVALAVSACESTAEYDDDPMYHQGYYDGCAVGTSGSRERPPAELMDDDAYRTGWRAGYGACSGNTDERRDPLPEDTAPGQSPF